MGERNRPMKGVPNQSWNEPQIFKNVPKWAHLEESGRVGSLVKFRTKTGYILVPEKDVADWKRYQEKKGAE